MRKASLIFGSTTFAVSTVLAVFFLGLACGSYLFGRIGQVTARPLKLYALIELVLGLFALVSPYAFDLVDNLYGELYRAFADRIALLILCAFHSGLARRSAPNNTHGRNAPALLPLVCRQRLKDR